MSSPIQPFRKTYTYSFYLSFGVTVESEDELDFEYFEDFKRLRDLTVQQLEDEGVQGIVHRSDFGDIDLIED